MPAGITSLSWDFQAGGLRIQRLRDTDLVFNRGNIPGVIENQGAQAITDWLNKDQNLAKLVWGAQAPSPYMVAKVRTMSPFYFDYLVSDQPFPWFDTLGEVYPFP